MSYRHCMKIEQVGQFHICECSCEWRSTPYSVRSSAEIHPLAHTVHLRDSGELADGLHVYHWQSTPSNAADTDEGWVIADGPFEAVASVFPGPAYLHRVVFDREEVDIYGSSAGDTVSVRRVWKVTL